MRNAEHHINSVYVKEGVSYSTEAIVNVLKLNANNFDEKKATNLIQQLINFHLLTKSKKEDSSNHDDDYASDWEDLDYSDSDTWKSLTFSFVGLYYYNGILIKSIPKYFKTKELDSKPDNSFNDKDAVLPKFKQVLKVIEKYKERHSLKIAAVKESTKETNHLSLVLSIIEDYYEHGIYNNDQTIKELNGNGSIDWNYTVNNFYPLIKNNKPYYLDYLTVKRRSVDDSYFFRLHKAIISNCSRELKECDLIELMDFDELDLSDEEISDFGETETICYNIENELNTQFNTQKIETLKMILAYIHSGKNTIDDHDDFKLFRVNKFDPVWEEACRFAVGDDLKTKLGKLIANELKECNSEHLKSLGAESTFKDVMEHPRWYPDGRNEKFASSAPLKLDSIKYYNRSLYIFDAKYYVPSLTQKESENKEQYKISDIPGVGDITKQYLYQLAYKEFSDTTGIRIVSNAFLMPKDDETKPNKFCDVKMNMFENLKIDFQNIQVLQVSAKDIFDCYLKEKPKSLDYFIRN